MNAADDIKGASSSSQSRFFFTLNVVQRIKFVRKRSQQVKIAILIVRTAAQWILCKIFQNADNMTE